MSSHSPAPVVEARDLSRRFGRRWAFARVDLDVQPGERLLVFGANGSGKTTLLRTLSTLLSPSAGRLRLFGMDPIGERDDVRRRLAMVSHQTGLYEDLSARDNLTFLARLTGRPADIGALLDRVGLADRPEPIRAYSAGMRKRAAIAAMLLQQPEICLLDEPFSALDPKGVDQLADIIRTMPGTVIMTSHRIAYAASICDRGLLLHEGQVRWSGPATDAWSAWCALHPASVVPA